MVPTIGVTVFPLSIERQWYKIYNHQKSGHASLAHNAVFSSTEPKSDG